MVKRYLLIILLLMTIPIPAHADALMDYWNNMEQRQAEEAKMRQDNIFRWTMGIGAMAFGVVFLIRGKRKKDPMEELRLRYAKGDISEEEYLHQVNILKS